MSPPNTAPQKELGKDNVVPIEKPMASPLPDGISSVEPFDYALLPEVFRPWIKDTAERMQCPPDYLAVSAMVAIAALAGRQVTIRPKRNDNWSVVPNLFGAVVGPPGVLKSPALKEPIGPLYAFQSKAMEDFDLDCQTFEAKELVYQEKVKLERLNVKGELDSKCPNNAENKAIELVKEKPIAPVCRRYVVNDTTIERLQEILSENPNGVLQFRDELTGFLRQMHKPGHETDRAFFLEAWNGDSSHTTDRIGRGMTHVESACVSIIGGIQPGPLKGFFSSLAHSGNEDDGLLQRFQLLVYPDVSKTWINVDRQPDRAARETALEVYTRLQDIDTSQFCIDEDLPYVRFTDPAQEVFDKWRAELETRLRSGDEQPAIEAHLSKYRSLVPSLALLIHLANGEPGNVDLDCVRTALAWAIYLESHARRVYAPVLNPDMECARALAAKIQQGKLGESFTIKEVYGSHWSNLTNSEQARAAVNILIDYDWLDVKQEETKGKPKTEYIVNPTVREL